MAEQVRCLLRTYRNAKGEPQMEVCLHNDRTQVLVFAMYKDKKGWWANVNQSALQKVFDDMQNGKYVAEPPTCCAHHRNGGAFDDKGCSYT